MILYVLHITFSHASINATATYVIEKEKTQIHAEVVIMKQKWKGREGSAGGWGGGGEQARAMFMVSNKAYRQLDTVLWFSNKKLKPLKIFSAVTYRAAVTTL